MVVTLTLVPGPNAGSGIALGPFLKFILHATLKIC